MSTPGWILEIFGAVMLLVAEASAGQLAVARAWTRRGGAGADIAVSRLLTGIATAGVLVPALSPLPNAVWEVVFAVLTAWFGWRLWRARRGAAAAARGRYAPALVYSAAMLYLFAAAAGSSGSGLPASGGMSGMAGAAGVPAPHASTLALIFALLLIAVTVHDLNRRAGASDSAGYTAERLLLSPAVAKGCQVTTGVTMAFMLIIAI